VTRLRALAPAKVNLCLFLGKPRADGKHELVTLFESVSLADELELSTDREGDRVVCPGVEGPNLVERALAELRARGWGGPAVQIEVRKRIPIAAGMGGGSADAAAALRMAVELAPGRPEEIVELAASLGADVPSQLTPGVVLGTGAGELVEPFEPLAAHALLVLPSSVRLATPEVYAEADRLGLPRAREELQSRYEQLLAALRPDARLPDELFVNDLEPATVSLRPQVADALAAARDAGAENVLVCGSGPTVIGVFWGPQAQDRAEAAAAQLALAIPGTTAVLPVNREFAAPRALWCR
jgi:4-diphosphocytidyl-2-C-methyl-D-erythritol kinase